MVAIVQIIAFSVSTGLQAKLQPCTKSSYPVLSFFCAH